MNIVCLDMEGVLVPEIWRPEQDQRAARIQGDRNSGVGANHKRRAGLR